MKRNFSGFTLLNLLITLTISGILAGAGIPSVMTLLANNQANTNYEQLFTLVQFTRTQSVNYRSQVILCPSVNQQECINDWNQELMVFVDLDNDEKRNSEEPLLQIRSAMNNEENLIWSAFGKKKHLRFNATGSTYNQNGRLTYCFYQGNDIYARQIIISKAGRARKVNNKEAEKKC